MAMNYIDIAERVRIGTLTPNENGCALFIGRRDSHGYGQVKNHSKAVLVHRWIWEQANGKIPDGMLVCHRCDVRNCLTLDHLFLGTHKDNMLDKKEKGRSKSVPRGYAHKRPMAKVTESQVREIKSLLARGYKQADISRDFKVSRQIVSDIALRKTWAHLDNGS